MQRANKYAKSKTMDFNKISEFQHECYRVIKWFQIHKKLSWFNDWICAFTKQSLSILQKEKEKKKAWTFPYPNNVSMADVAIFLHTIHFSSLNLERNILILYTLKELLYMKKLFLLDYSYSLSENCLKLVMLKQSWKSSNYQIKNRKVNCYSSSTGLKQWSCIKGNFTVNAMEVCQKIIVHTCSF